MSENVSRRFLPNFVRDTSGASQGGAIYNTSTTYLQTSAKYTSPTDEAIWAGTAISLNISSFKNQQNATKATSYENLNGFMTSDQDMRSEPARGTSAPIHTDGGTISVYRTGTEQLFWLKIDTAFAATLINAQASAAKFSYDFTKQMIIAPNATPWVLRPPTLVKISLSSNISIIKDPVINGANFAFNEALVLVLL
jgi:hypothetical protein